LFPFFRSRDTTDSPPLRMWELLASSVVLFRLLPALRGLETLADVLLLTFAAVSLIRFAIASGRRGTLDEVFGEMLSASAALVWISFAIPLFAQRYGIAPAGWINGATSGLRELTSAVLSWLVLTGVLRLAARQNHPLVRRDDLRGLLTTSPLTGMLFAIGLLNWIGFPPLAGFAARIGLLSGLFGLTSAGTTASGGYALAALVVLAAECWMAGVALWQLQPVASPLSLRRNPRRVPLWSSLPLLLAAAAILWIGLQPSSGP
jgi:NADH:ubiquinone oxidoreductase subunit 2 (subunit N)